MQHQSARSRWAKPVTETASSPRSVFGTGDGVLAAQSLVGLLLGPAPSKGLVLAAGPQPSLQDLHLQSALWLTLSCSVRAGRVTQIWFWLPGTWAGPGVPCVAVHVLGLLVSSDEGFACPSRAEAAVPKWREGGEKLCRSSYITGCEDVPISVTGGMVLNPYLSHASLSLTCSL